MEKSSIFYPYITEGVCHTEAVNKAICSPYQEHIYTDWGLAFL